MSSQGFVEAQIEEARRRGEFENLPHRGEPLPGFDGRYDENWWVKQYLKREDLSFLPPSLQLKRDVEKALEQIDRAPTREAVLARVAQLNAHIREVNRRPAEGPPSTTAPLDPETVLRRWEAHRAARPPRPPALAPRHEAVDVAHARAAAAILGSLALFTGALVWLALAA